jgi:EAL domain-containing protein (putative c-di-GMP-specific phosphodiesterase class I)
VRLVAQRFGISARKLLALRRLHVDRMKIDLSVFPDLTANPDEAAVVAGLFHLAGNLGLEVSAASVETQAQLTFLRENGCREAQGRAIAHPVDANQLALMLDSPGR